MVKAYTTTPFVRLLPTHPTHLEKKSGPIDATPLQAGEGSTVVLPSDPSADLLEVVRTKRIRCLFEYGEGLMNCDLRFCSFDKRCKRKLQRGNVYMKSPDDGWGNLSSEEDGVARYIDFCRCLRGKVVFNDKACKEIEEAFVELRRRAGGAHQKAVTEHDLEIWMILLRGRVRGRGGGEVVKKDVDWVVEAWKEGKGVIE